MKQILIFFLLAAKVAGAQNTIEIWVVGADSVYVKNVEEFPGAVDYQVIVQNQDDLTQSVWFWDDDGEGMFPMPYCNARVTRTAFDSSLVAWSGNVDTISRLDVYVKVSAMPGKKVLVKVEGGDFDLSFHKFSTGAAYTYYTNVWQWYPVGHFQEGTYTAFIPYVQAGVQVAKVVVSGAGCKQTVGRIFYLN